MPNITFKRVREPAYNADQRCYVGKLADRDIVIRVFLSNYEPWMSVVVGGVSVFRDKMTEEHKRELDELYKRACKWSEELRWWAQQQLSDDPLEEDKFVALYQKRKLWDLWP